MAFSKSFPKTTDKSAYPTWVEIYLTGQEERDIEAEARSENMRLMGQCIADARKLAGEHGLKDFQTDIVSMAIALFEKQASHTVFWKESRAKDRFDELHAKR